MHPQPSLQPSLANTERGELFSILLRLQPVEAGWVSPSSGSQAQAAFLDMIRQNDPELSERLHQADRRRPYTVGLLQGFNHLSAAQLQEAMAYGQQVQALPGQVYWLRFTILDASVFSTFAHHLFTRPRFSALRIGSTYFEIGRLLDASNPNGASHPWAAHSSFADLNLSVKPWERYSFEFASPTAFSRGQQSWGKSTHLFPEPALVFESLARSWEMFAPAHMRLSAAGLMVRDIADWCEENVIVGRYSLETRTLHFKKFGQVGFQGTIIYERKGDASAPEATWLSRLARFALFSGVGYKTSMGMGQTRCTNFSIGQPSGNGS